MLCFACTLASIICTLTRVLSAPGHAGKQRVARASTEVTLGGKVAALTRGS